MNKFKLSPEMQISVAILFFAVACVLVFFAVKAALDEARTTNRRLAGATESEAAEMAATGSGAASSAFTKFAGQITLPDAREISRVRYLLSQAGFFSPSAVNVFYAVRVLSIILPQLILVAGWGLIDHGFYLKYLLPASAALGLLGLFGPVMAVKHLKKRRTYICKDGFPDMMDLLVACIEAGLGLDAALVRVARELERRYPPLKTGLDLMNLELRAGRARHDALKNFAERLDLEEAKALAVMLKQSEEMGSSLGESLRSFSDEMRAKRMLMAEEKALALSAKLTVPLIFFIFPTIMIMLLMPAGIRLAEGL